MNQRRYIEKQSKLSEIEIDNIKKRIWKGIECDKQPNKLCTRWCVCRRKQQLNEETNEDEVEPSQNPTEIEELVKEIKRVKAEWENTRMAEKSPLPKIKMNV